VRINPLQHCCCSRIRLQNPNPNQFLSPPPNMASKSTNAGIVTDATSGERHIPESTRADGSTRKAIKIRPGYRPAEDVEVYKNRTAETFRNIGKGPVPGAESLSNDGPTSTSSANSNKNAKRREARRKAKASDETKKADAEPEPVSEPQEEVDPEAEREKKARALKKKLKQAKELQSKKDGGGTLLPEQIAKVIKISELIRELEALGFDQDGEPKVQGSEAPKAKGTAKGTAKGKAP
jgi:partner of Y14 and mago